MIAGPKFSIALLAAGTLAAACMHKSSEPPATTASDSPPLASELPSANDTPATATAPVLVSAVEQPATKATSNCPTVVVSAKQGEKIVGTVRLQAECAEAPDYKCGEHGQGCATTSYYVGEQVTFGDRHFVWITSNESRDVNDMDSQLLYGFGCGKLAPVWGYTSGDQGVSTNVELEARKNGLELVAVMTTEAQADDDETPEVDETTTILEWDPARCVYSRKKR